MTRKVTGETGATEPTEPTVLTEPTEPTAPSEPTEPTEPTAQTEPTEPTAPTEPVAPTAPLSGSFPVQALSAGQRARRKSWAPGYELLATEAGGRSGARLKLMITGSRSGLIEWKPQHPADELLSMDWMVIAEPEPLP